MAPKPAHTPPLVLGYVRVSTAEQHASGAGLAAQRSALEAEAERRGWELELVQEEALSARNLNRPALVAALDRLDRHEADVLMVAKLDRLSRSVVDFGGLLERASRRGWSVVALDVGVDMSSPVGEMVANVVAAIGQFERKLIGARTRDALAEKRAAGVRIGRPQSLPDDVVRRIVAERAAGGSFREIGAGLEADGVPTARGGSTWYASTVKAVVESAAGARLRVP